MAHQHEEDGLDGARMDEPRAAREVVRLFQCRRCSLPYKDAVTLPCGRSLCKTCLPQPHVRSSITYPALPDRLQGFQCPFDECRREHAASDCSVDVLLNKVAGSVRDEMARRRAEALQLELSTQVVVLDAWGAAGVASLQGDDEASPRVLAGGKMVATWTLAEEGGLDLDSEASYRELPKPDALDTEALEQNIWRKMRQAARGEMDCQVCYALFHEPLTTGCGHTFCRSCLHRILDHSTYCPICRRRLAINPLLDRASCPSNQAISSIIETFWSDDLVARQEAHAAEQAANQQQLEVPLFVCTLAFPRMPTFLHVFEPRYRLMIRRALDGDGTFGVVLPKRPQGSHDAHFHELGTLLRIVSAQYYPDGRSLIETVGLSRFRVLRHGALDGYAVCSTERIDDISLEEEEALEAAEALPEPTDTAIDDGAEDDAQEDEGSSKLSVADTERMSTQNLMQFATSFVARMREQSVPWLTQRTLRVYGECPDDPAIFPWWFASILPVRDLEKYRLLGTSSVRDRLKICCSWIVEWETSRCHPGSAGAPSSE